MFSAATASSYIQAHSLPPACSAAKDHPLSVYLQFQQWAGNGKLEASQWGWKMRQTFLLPMTTELPPAPMWGKTRCEAKACSCMRNKLNCTLVCK